MTRLQKFGVAAIALPLPLFLLNLAAYSVLQFSAMVVVAADTSNDNPTIYLLAAANQVLGLLGILLIIAIPVGLIVGVVLLIIGKKPLEQAPPPTTPIPPLP